MITFAVLAVLLGVLGLIVAVRNVNLRNESDRVKERQESLKTVIFTAICERNGDYAIGYGDGVELADSITEAVREHLNQP